MGAWPCEEVDTVMMSDLRNQVERVLAARMLANAETPVLLMVSGGSDSTAMAYL